MTLVGKILVMAVLIMSVVFAGFTVAVHATHKNWKFLVENDVAGQGKPLGLMPQLKQKDSEVNQLKGELTRKLNVLNRTIREYEYRVAQLQSGLSAMTADRDRLDALYTKNETDLQDERKNLETKVKLLTDIREKNDSLRIEVDKTKKERDDSLDDVTRLVDSLAQAQGEENRLQKRQKDLLVQLTQYYMVIQDNDLPLNLDKPRVSGLVTATRTQQGLVEINLGSDDGLKAKDTLDVFRVGATLATTSYLGRIVLTNVNKSVAVGRLIRGLSGSGTIQKNDRVATYLNRVN